MPTNNYYNDNAQLFFDGTISVDVSSLYQEFLPLLPKKANIVDAGCGSGRDTHYFLQQGHDVTAFDASDALIQLAMKRTQHSILHCTFLTSDIPNNSQDAIWACASLLHVPMNEMSDTFLHLSHCLKQKGIFYCSFKYGDNEIERNGRRFTNLNEHLLNQILINSPLSIQKTWITEDLRQGRSDEKWLNAILIKDNK